MATHSVSGRGDAVLVIERGAGGRIYEQAADGGEFSWGTLVAWEPPSRLVCEWLVGDTPTELGVRFAADGDGGAGVGLEHRGWELFGKGGGQPRARDGKGWAGGRPRYLAGWDPGGAGA